MSAVDRMLANSSLGRRPWAIACALSLVLHGSLLAWSATICWSSYSEPRPEREYVFELHVRGAPPAERDEAPGPSAPEVPIAPPLAEPPPLEQHEAPAAPELTADASTPPRDAPLPEPPTESVTVEPPPATELAVLLPVVLEPEPPVAVATLGAAAGAGAPATAFEAPAGSSQTPDAGQGERAAGSRSEAPGAFVNSAGTGAVVATSSPAPETRPAVALETPRPKYPYESELRGEHGVVLCLLHIGADGGVTDVEILESCGYGRLDRSALEALKRWRFRPALEHGKAVASTLRHQVTFVFE